MKLSLFLFILVGPCCVLTNQLLQYHFINEDKNWTEAQDYCKDKHTNLATVISMADMNRLRQKLGNRKAWIGLHREASSNRTWQWSQPDVQFNESRDNGWNESEPDDNDIENCGTLRPNKKWADLSCDREKPFICYDETNSSHVIYAKEERNWTDAQSFCRDHHTDLISGPEQMEKLDVVTTEELFLNVSINNLIFIGLFRDAWQWSDGSSFSFRFWNLQYNDEKKDRSCAVMNEEGRWSSEKCNETHPFICYNDHVILIKESRTWEEALYYCRHHHHDLVTITNPEEQLWVQEKTKKALTPFVWTGLRYTCTLGFWFWVSDEVVHYKNWNSPKQVNECDMSGAMETRGEHKWFKKHDEEKLNFICSTS